MAADDQRFLIVQTDQGAHFKIVFYGPDTVKIDHDGFADPDEAEASKTFFGFLQGGGNLVHLLLQAGEGAFFHGLKIENVGDGKRSFRSVLYSLTSRVPVFSSRPAAQRISSVADWQ